jgi:hypothetical protein
MRYEPAVGSCQQTEEYFDQPSDYYLAKNDLSPKKLS